MFVLEFEIRLAFQMRIIRDHDLGSVIDLISPRVLVSSTALM